MQTLIYSAYILVWPLITMTMLLLICRRTIRDWRDAKRTNSDML